VTAALAPSQPPNFAGDKTRKGAAGCGGGCGQWDTSVVELALENSV